MATAAEVVPRGGDFRANVTGADADVSIAGVDGREVRNWRGVPMSGGILELAWDGRDAGGHLLPSGHWFVNVRTEKGEIGCRITLLR